MIRYHCSQCGQVEDTDEGQIKDIWEMTIGPEHCRYCHAGRAFAELFGTPLGGM